MTRILNIWKAAGLAESWHLLHFKIMTCSFMCFLMATAWLLKTEIHHHPPCLISCDYKRITHGEFPQIKNMIYWSITSRNSLPIFTFEFNNSFLSSQHLMLMMNIWGSTENQFSGTNLNWLRNQSFKISISKVGQPSITRFFWNVFSVLWSHW